MNNFQQKLKDRIKAREDQIRLDHAEELALQKAEVDAEIAHRQQHSTDLSVEIIDTETAEVVYRDGTPYLMMLDGQAKRAKSPEYRNASR